MDTHLRTRPIDKYVTVDGLRLRYIEEGQGPAVLLLHGASLGEHLKALKKIADRRPSSSGDDPDADDAELRPRSSRGLEHHAARRRGGGPALAPTSSADGTADAGTRPLRKMPG